MNNTKALHRWSIVFLYAVAMAWVESAVVLDLRTMFARIDPYQPNPLPEIGNLGPAEIIREAATMIMLLTVGVLAGRNWRSRLGYSAIAFGVWDIFYYVFLRRLTGWPHSVMDWDLLFLIPLPWWGPVLAPVSVALLIDPLGHAGQYVGNPTRARSLGMESLDAQFHRGRCRALCIHGGFNPSGRSRRADH